MAVIAQSVGCAPIGDEDDLDSDGTSDGSAGAAGNGGGTGGDDGGGVAGGGGGGDTVAPEGCSDGARGYIYLLDEGGFLLRYKPDETKFEALGRPACATASKPFSMSVDRSAAAWILFQDGQIFRVDTTTLDCQATGFAPGQAGLTQFGMGFASNSAGSGAETLFVAGGALPGIGGTTLARIDTPALTVATIGPLDGWIEMTGNGLGELWGFAPTPPEVFRLDKSNATKLDRHQLSGMPTDFALAYAFAFWGGAFHVFLRGAAAFSSNVWKYDLATGQLTTAVTNSGYIIVGAGVSTCAPTEPPT